jgi:hypothetical protein
MQILCNNTVDLQNVSKMCKFSYFQDILCMHLELCLCKVLKRENCIFIECVDMIKSEYILMVNDASVLIVLVLIHLHEM